METISQSDEPSMGVSSVQSIELSYWRGREAAKYRLRLDANPYPPTTAVWEAWREGHYDEGVRVVLG
jgi:hypothetical protein